MNFNMRVNRIGEILVVGIFHPLYIFQLALNVRNLVVEHFVPQIMFKQRLQNKPYIIRDFGKILHTHPHERVFKELLQEFDDLLGVSLKCQGVVGRKTLDNVSSTNDTINDNGSVPHQLVVDGWINRGRIVIQGMRD